MRALKKLLLSLFLLTSLSFARASEVSVFAAVSLTDALKEIAANYMKTSGDKITFNFAASNTLVTQIKVGAPADIFFSADEAKMDDLEKEKLVGKATRKDLLSNSLVIVAFASDLEQKLASGKDLAGPKFKKIALGQPESVPAGIYAKEYLQKIGIWDQLTGHIVPCESVRTALAAVETGNVDAGIVYKTDALSTPKVAVIYEVPVAEGPAIAYPVAIVDHPAIGPIGPQMAHHVAVQKFYDYLSTPDALKVFEKYGFLTKK